jgi:hypothetical protein
VGCFSIVDRLSMRASLPAGDRLSQRDLSFSASAGSMPPSNSLVNARMNSFLRIFPKVERTSTFGSLKVPEIWKASHHLSDWFQPLDLVRLKIHLWPAVKIPVVHGAIVDREAINIEGEEFLDDMQPGFVDSDLASLPRGTLHKVYDWRIKIDLADQRAVEECDDLARG